MERRRLLQLAAGTALGTLGVSGEPIRRLLDLSLGAGFRSIEEWDLACADHLHALRTRPPAQVAADLIIDLATIREQMDVSSPTEVTALHRTTSALAVVHANVLTRLGEHSAAIRWSRTARQAADVCGDLQLRLLARAKEAGQGLYGQRDPEIVLRLVHSAQRIAGEPTIDLLTAQAKALTLLGRHDEARTTLDALHRLAERGIAADPQGFWKPDQLHFAESWVYAGAGDERKASKARDEVLRFAPEYQYRTNVILHRAWSMIAQGGIDEGARQAASTIDGLSPAYRSTMILETGRMVLHAVPVEQQDRPAVGEFREVLAAGAA